METNYSKTNMLQEQAEIAARTWGIEVKVCVPEGRAGETRWVYPALVSGFWNAFWEPGEFYGWPTGIAAAGLKYQDSTGRFVGDGVLYEPIIKPTPEQILEPWLSLLARR